MVMDNIIQPCDFKGYGVGAGFSDGTGGIRGDDTSDTNGYGYGISFNNIE